MIRLITFFALIGFVSAACPVGQEAFPQLTVSGLVWDDVNGNGLREATEHGIESIPVQLWSAGSPRVLLTTVLSDADGKYQIKNPEDVCQDGQFVVHFDRPSGWKFSPALGSDHSKNSDVIGQDGFSLAFDWSKASIPVTHIDAGLVAPDMPEPRCSCVDCFDRSEIRRQWTSIYYQRAYTSVRVSFP